MDECKSLVVGSKVYFAPDKLHDVGVMDAVTGGGLHSSTLSARRKHFWWDTLGAFSSVLKCRLVITRKLEHETAH